MTFLNHKRLSFFTIVLFLFLVNEVKAQSILFPPDYLFDVQRQKNIFTDTSEIIHSSMQPLMYKAAAPDTIWLAKPGEDLFFDKLVYDDLLKVKYIDKSSGYDRKFNLSIDPVFNFSYAKDQKDPKKESFVNNTRGVWIKGEIGKKFFFETSFFENQSTFPTYLRNYCATALIVPGQGRWKTFKTNGFDYAMANGVMHYQPGKNFSV